MTIFKYFFLELFLKGLVVSLLISILFVPILLKTSQLFDYIHTYTSIDYRKLKEKEEALAIGLKNNFTRDSFNFIIQEIKVLEKKGTYGAAYSLAVFYNYGISGYLIRSKPLCDEYRFRSMERYNPSAVLLNC